MRSPILFAMALLCLLPTSCVGNNHESKKTDELSKILFLNQNWCEYNCTDFNITVFEDGKARLVQHNRENEVMDSSFSVSRRSIDEILETARRENFFREIDYQYEIHKTGQTDSTPVGLGGDTNWSSIYLSDEKFNREKWALVYQFKTEEIVFQTRDKYFSLRKLILEKTVGTSPKYGYNKYDNILP